MAVVITELFAAVAEGRESKVKELIGNGISPNSFKDESHMTPLHYCTQVGDVQMFKSLLDSKASLRKRDRWMDSVVHYACRYGNIHILELIIKENSRQQNRIQLKQQAMAKQIEAQFKCLKGKNTKTNQTQHNKIQLEKEPLKRKLRQPYALEKKLTDKKAKPNLLNLKGKECRLPISEAIINGHISCVVKLLNSGAAIDIRDQRGTAPIDLLLELPTDLQIDMFDNLINCDSKMEEQNPFFVTFCTYGGLYQNDKIQEKIDDILNNFSQSDKEKWLEILVQHDCLAEVKKLLQEPNYYTWNVLRSVLKKAVEFSHLEIVRLVLNEQTGILADDDCLKLCITNQSVGVLKYLLKFSTNMQSWHEDENKRVICLALKTGNVDVVSALFDQFDNPLTYVEADEKLWVKLVKDKSEELIKYLLNAGVKLNDDKNKSCFHAPLVAAIKSQNESILKCLIVAGAKPQDPQQILEVAITTQNTEIVKLALTLPGSNLNDQKITRAVIQTKNLHFIEILIGLGLKLYSPDVYIFRSWTALTTAVETKELSIVKLVYNSGGRMFNSKEEIWKAIEQSSLDILDFFLQECSIFKLRKKSAWTPLHQAVKQNNLEIVKLLVKHMTQHEINIIGHDSPLSMAISRTNIEITEFLISAGVDINKGQNLYNAVVSGSEEIVIILLKAGISTCLGTSFGLTILHVAVIRNNLNIVKQLLQLKYIDINAKVDLSDTRENYFEQKYGYLYSVGMQSYENLKSETTAIQLAVKQNSEDIVQQLLIHNADITIANKVGCRPWAEAIFNCNNVLMTLMLPKLISRHSEIDVNAICEIDYKTRIKCTRSTSLNNSFWQECYSKHVGNGTLIYFALGLGNMEAVRTLLGHGASVSKANSNGETAIFGLTLLFNDREKLYQAVKILIEKGTNINHVNVDSSTVLNKAVKDGNYELVNVLILEGADIDSVKVETFEILLKSDLYFDDKYICNMKIVSLLLQHGYNLQHSLTLDNWLLSLTSTPYVEKISKVQHIICEILYHMKGLGFKNKLSQLLHTSVKYDLQILGKYLVSEGCDVNESCKSTYPPHQRNALGIALESGNFPFMQILLDAGAKYTHIFKNKFLLNRVFEKVADSFNTRQYSTYSIDLFDINDSFLYAERNDAKISSIINVFDTILNQDFDFKEHFALDNFQDSVIALSIKYNLPWAVEYFVKHDTLKHTLHSEHICELFDLSLGKFYTSTKILIDEFGTKLVQSNPAKVLKLYMNGHVTEEEQIDLTQSLIDKGLNMNNLDDDRRMVLCTFLCEALEIVIQRHHFKLANFLLPPTYPNGIEQSKAESLILDVFNCEIRNLDTNSKRSFLKELLKFITSASSYENLLESAFFENDLLKVEVLLEGRNKIYEENEKEMLSFLRENLIKASKCHFVEIMEELIDAGAEFKLEKGTSALHQLCALPPNHVCNGKCFGMLKTLIKQGNMTNMEDENGKLPLYHAIAYMNYDASKLLIEAGSLIAPYGHNSASPISLYCSKMYEYQLYGGDQTERIALMTRLLLNTGKALIGNNLPPEVIHDVIVHEREEVLFLISKFKAHLQYCDSDGNTALHIGCKQDSCKILTMLLNLECEVNAQNNDGRTPLLLACEQGKYDFVKLLVQNGAKSDVPDSIGITPIHMAIISRPYEAVLLLLNKPCNVNNRTKSYHESITAGSTPLVTVLSKDTFYISQKTMEIAEKLVNMGADLNICNEDGDSPLHIAIRNSCNESFLTTLLNSSSMIKVNAQNKNGSTPLLLSCESNNYNMDNLAKILVEHGAKLDVPDNNGITPIHMGIISGLYEAVLLLLGKECNVNTKTKYVYRSIKAGSTPLMTALAIYTDRSQVIADKLIDAGADVDICNEDCDSPLHIAIRNKCKEALLLKLLSRSVNDGIQNSKGWSVLHLAVKNQEQNIVHIMLKEKYDVNARIYDHSLEFPGYTALHIAVHHTNVSLVEMLLKAGSNMFEKDITGKTGMDLCEIDSCMTEKLPLWSVLLKAGGSVKRLTPNRDLLKMLHNTNLFNLLIASGCVVQFEGHHLLEPECSILEEISNKQQQPLSLMRLAGNTVRTNIHPNAFYSIHKLPLPESVQQFICFDDSEHDVNNTAIQSYSVKLEAQSKLLRQLELQ